MYHVHVSFVHLSESKRKHQTFFRKDLTNFLYYFIHLITANLLVNCQYV